MVTLDTYFMGGVMEVFSEEFGEVIKDLGFIFESTGKAGEDSHITVHVHGKKGEFTDRIKDKIKSVIPQRYPIFGQEIPVNLYFMEPPKFEEMIY